MTNALDISPLTTGAIEAEAATLGSMILDWSCAIDVVSITEPDDFVDLRVVAKAMWSLYEADMDGGDMIVLRDYLKTKGELDDIGIEDCKGALFLARIAGTVPAAANAVYYAKLVKKNSRKNENKLAAAEMVKIAGEGGDPDETVAKMIEIIDGVSEVEEDGIYTFAEALHSTVTAAPEKSIKTGFHEIDSMSPVLPSDYIIIGARPAHGKTAFGLESARHIAKEYGRVLFFSAEMSHQRVTGRAMQYEAGTNWRGNAEAQCEMANLPITIIDKSYLTTRILYNTIKAQQKIHEVKAVFVDHFHLMTSSGKFKNTIDEYTNRSLEIRLMAKSLNIPVFVLAQLSRAVESRDTKRPRMSDLRGCGAIEQDATAVWMLHRTDEDHKFDEIYKPNHEGHIYIDKNRDGVTGRVTLLFDQEVFTFKNRGQDYK